MRLETMNHRARAQMRACGVAGSRFGWFRSELPVHSSGSLTLLLLEQHERGVLSESAKFYVRSSRARNGLTVFKTLLCCLLGRDLRGEESEYKLDFQ